MIVPSWHSLLLGPDLLNKCTWPINVQIKPRSWERSPVGTWAMEPGRDRGCGEGAKVGKGFVSQFYSQRLEKGFESQFYTQRLGEDSSPTSTPRSGVSGCLWIFFCFSPPTQSWWLQGTEEWLCQAAPMTQDSVGTAECPEGAVTAPLLRPSTATHPHPITPTAACARHHWKIPLLGLLRSTYPSNPWICPPHSHTRAGCKYSCLGWLLPQRRFKPWEATIHKTPALDPPTIPIQALPGTAGSVILIHTFTPHVCAAP